MNRIFHEINDEREYQKAKWGDVVDDEKNMPNDWVAYITKYSTRWFPGGFPPYDEETLEEFRTCMIKVAALAVAAIESTDRKNVN